MFENLSTYSKILVTGPQRSGTTIAARMIAHTTGHQFVDEWDFNVSDLGMFHRLFYTPGPMVIQCPALCRCVHHYADERAMVVLMRRPPTEIADSVRRIRWEGNLPQEMTQYGITLPKSDLTNRKLVIDWIDTKYDFWNEIQAPCIPNSIEIAYNSLSNNPLWVPADRRKEFNAKQTSEWPA